jgi:DNA invertase Pin-like site-specific DNA recombinase
MIASAEPLEPFESEAAKVAYCRAFLEQRGYAVSEPLPAQKPRDREPRSLAYVLISAKRPREMQEQLILGAIDAVGSSVPRFAGAFIDEYSAAGKRLADRPGGRKLWNTLDCGDHLWLSHYDHLGRGDLDSLQELERIFRWGVVIHVADFLGNQFLAIRDEDMIPVLLLREQITARRQFIGERTKYGMDHSRAAGRPMNGVAPIGYQKAGLGKRARFKAHHQDQRNSNAIWRMGRELNWRPKTICRELKKRRVLIPTGHSQGRGWSVDRIKKVLAYASPPFPNCPEGATRVDDLLDSAAC